MTPRLGRARLKVVIGLAALVTGMLGGAFALFEPAAQASVNLSCPQGTSEYKVDGNQLHINAGQMPTLANTAKLVTIEKREDSRLDTTPSGTLDGRKRNTQCAS